MKKLLSTLILSLSILSLIPTQVYADELTNYYGIVQGNGLQSTIHLKVSDSWQTYIIDSDYIGYECKLITTDNILTNDDYKDIQILNVSDITQYTSDNIDTINGTINEWNHYIVSLRK